MKRVLFLCICLITVLRSEGGSRLSLSDLFYTYVQDDIYPCFRLTNATHQIGCSGSATSTKGVLYYLNDTGDLARLKQSSPHAPYIALLEPAIFVAETVLELKTLSSVKGIVVRHDPNLMSMDKIPAQFSPERKCPNDLFGEETSGCNKVWNPNGTNLIFTDFGNFPIFALPSSSFDSLVKCYSDLSRGNTGSSRDYPLCAVELTADMAVVRDTPTCFRRGALPVPYLNSQSFCDPLGDYSPWGSLFNLTDSTTDQVILLTAKLDSISFFPGVLSPGASSEVAAIATLMGVIHQLGQAKRSGDITNTQKRILYAFLHGESWDYIGSSRMAYDMKNGNFPHKLELPRIGLTNVSDILELGQLGFILNSKVYVHGNLEDSSSLIKSLVDYASVVGINVEKSSVSDLPPASLQRFIREGVKQGNSDFKGSVLTGFDSEFINRYYGSRFDNILNLGSDSLSLVADRLANLSTAIAKAVLNDSRPSCVSVSCSDAMDAMTADSNLIHDILTCFLVDASCDRFKSIFINRTAGALFTNGSKLSRYVTVDRLNNSESVIVRQMMAWLSANDDMQRLHPINCSTCLERILSGDDKTLNVTWMQYSGPDSRGDEDLCYCVESYTYSHSAKSPAFDVSSIGYGSREYSTWAESSWNSVQVRIFLAPSTGLEVGFFFVGIAFASLTLAVSVVCTWKGSFLFNEGKSY